MRLIIISNRLPLTIKKHDHSFEYKQTSGRLVTGLKAVKETLPFLWLGNISGLKLTDEDKETILKDCWELFKSIPVFIEPELNEKSYNGFCNGILWPLVHSFPDDVSFNHLYFEGYKEYNTIFCDKVCEIAKDGDIIWVHDYHLMLLPNMLRKKIKKNVKIGYFLHTPFPIADIFTVLPCAKDIVEGILGSDHIAFHCYDYLANFLETCAVLALNVNDVIKQSNNETKIDYMPGHLKIEDRDINFTAVPIGIDPDLFKECLKKTETRTRLADLKAKFKGKRVILGVDRTDFIKGIPNRIKGFQRYLEKYQDKNTIFLQISVPSRLDVPEYASLVNTFNTMVTELNGSLGSVDETFFYILNNSIPFEELCALYAFADICLISSLVDGMNLVALEFIACQEEKKGVLMLSEFTGCSTTLPGALFFNPWNTDEIASKIDIALKMNDLEKNDRFIVNSENVKKFTAVKWAKDNVEGLQESIKELDK